MCSSKNLVINCQCSSTPKAKSQRRATDSSPGRALKPVGLRASRKEPTVEIKVRWVRDLFRRKIEVDDNQNDPSGLPALAGQNLSLSSRTSGQRHIVRAIFRPGVPDNIIARRIVRRLGLTSGCNSAVVKTFSWDRSPLPATSDFVDLACYSENGNDCDSFRFYVVQGCPFDILFGSDSISSFNSA
jgi:hypothetical protein